MLQRRLAASVLAPFRHPLLNPLETRMLPSNAVLDFAVVRTLTTRPQFAQIGVRCYHASARGSSEASGPSIPPGSERVPGRLERIWLFWAARMNKHTALFVTSIFLTTVAYRLMMTREENGRLQKAKDKQIQILTEKLAHERAAVGVRKQQLQSILDSFEAKLDYGALTECKRMRKEIDAVLEDTEREPMAVLASATVAKEKTADAAPKAPEAPKAIRVM